MTQIEKPPHSFACDNADCPEYQIGKDALTTIVGDVFCGRCETVCLDLGPVGGSDNA